MAYQRWWKTIRDQQGNAVNGANCAVYNGGTGTLATIYGPNTDDSAPGSLSNPFVTGANGVFGFMAADGEYDVKVSGGSLASQQYRVTLNGFVSGSAGSLAADLAAPTGAGMVGYGTGTVKDALDSAALIPAAYQAADAVVTSAVTAAFQSADSALSSRVSAVEIGQSAAVVGYDTQANLYANLVPVAGSVAYVTNDPTASKNGTYRKVGGTGTGSWVQSSYDRVALVETRSTNLENYRSKVGSGKNMFNAAAVTADFILTATGALTASPGYFTSELIPVNPSTAYAVSIVRHVCEYDASGAFIAGTHRDVSPSAVQAWTTNPAAAFVRISANSASYLATTQMETGATQTAWQAFYRKVVAPGGESLSAEPSLETSATIAANAAVVTSHLATHVKVVPGKNLFDKSVAVLDKILQSDGTLLTSAGYDTSGLCPVSPSTSYYINTARKVAEYDASGNFIAGTFADISPTAARTWTTNASAAYVKFSVAHGFIATTQLEAGSAGTSYEGWVGTIQGVAGAPLKVESVDVFSSVFPSEVQVYPMTGSTYAETYNAATTAMDLSISGLWRLRCRSAVVQLVATGASEMISLLEGEFWYVDIGSILGVTPTVTYGKGSIFPSGTPSINDSSSTKTRIVLATRGRGAFITWSLFSDWLLHTQMASNARVEPIEGAAFVREIEEHGRALESARYQTALIQAAQPSLELPWYGVEWYEGDTDGTALTRVASSTEALALHTTLPIQAGMRRCVTSATTGKVLYYLDASNSALKEDGTTANLDGTDGNVMVEIPRFFYKAETSIEPSGLHAGQRKCVLKLSQWALPGFLLHEQEYISAYETTINRTTGALASVCTTVFATGSASYTYTYGGSPDGSRTGNVTSVSSYTANAAQFRGVENNSAYDAVTTSDDNFSRCQLGRPAGGSGIGRSTFREAAASAGAWANVYPYDSHAALWMLAVVEFACRNFKLSPLGKGASNMNYDLGVAWDGNKPSLPCGITNSLGNASGVVTFWSQRFPVAVNTGVFTYGDFYTDVVSYRGIENFYGHVYKVVDGINIEYERLSSTTQSIRAYRCGSAVANRDDVSGLYDLAATLESTDPYVKLTSSISLADGLPLPIATTTDADYSHYYGGCMEFRPVTGYTQTVGSKMYAYLTVAGSLMSGSLTDPLFHFGATAADYWRQRDTTRLHHR